MPPQSVKKTDRIIQTIVIATKNRPTRQYGNVVCALHLNVNCFVFHLRKRIGRRIQQNVANILRLRFDVCRTRQVKNVLYRVSTCLVNSVVARGQFVRRFIRTAF